MAVSSRYRTDVGSGPARLSDAELLAADPLTDPAIPSVEQVTVAVHAVDPLAELSLLIQLRQRVEVAVVSPGGAAEVILAAVDSMDADAMCWLRSLSRSSGTPIVLVAGQVDPRVLVLVVEAGVCGALCRGSATPERLVRAISSAAAGQLDLPPELLRYLLDHVNPLILGMLEPRGLTGLTGPTAREREVLRLLAEGLSTREVALRLAYSERTIKGVVADLTTRLHLRNRTQVVAHAVRNGWI